MKIGQFLQQLIFSNFRVDEDDVDIAIEVGGRVGFFKHGLFEGSLIGQCN